jgi:hypothetical protein
VPSNSRKIPFFKPGRLIFRRAQYCPYLKKLLLFYKRNYF